MISKSGTKLQGIIKGAYLTGSGDKKDESFIVNEEWKRW